MIPCSEDARDAGEPLAGTAPLASAWIVIEQPGPWGRDALADSHLPADVAQHLAGAKAHGVSVLLARHPDRPERTGRSARHVWVARSVAGGHLLRHGVLDELGVITTWDLAGIGAGSLPAIGAMDAAPVTFVCTHSGRDRCCAVHGRALITGLLADVEPPARERIWECSHIGGHRFAPVMLTLPSGSVHGRLDGPLAREVVERSLRHEVEVGTLRGQSGFVPPFQVAVIEVMRATGSASDDLFDALLVTEGRAVPLRPGRPLDEALSVVEAEVRHRDGTAWRVVLERHPLDRLRLESCDKEPVAGHRWEVASLMPSQAWG